MLDNPKKTRVWQGARTGARPERVRAAERDGHAAAARDERALQRRQARPAALHLQQPRRLRQPPRGVLRQGF